MKLKSLLIIILFLSLIIYLPLSISYFDNKCISRGHDGVATLLGFPCACYKNNNSFGVNDKRGYEYYNLFID